LASSGAADFQEPPHPSGYLAIPKATLYTWRTRRSGFGSRAVKIDGCLRYRRMDLGAWIVEHLEAAADE
jgi:hypothetical protein